MARGVIGDHLVKRLKLDGFWVRGVDLKYPRYSETEAPANIGSSELFSINKLVELTLSIAGKGFSVSHVPGPLGVRRRNSDNRLIDC
jgi:hypothetical protein